MIKKFIAVMTAISLGLILTAAPGNAASPKTATFTATGLGPQTCC